MERHVQRLIDEGAPRFETSVEVSGQSPQTLLDRYLSGSPCGGPAPSGGAPTAAEMRGARPGPPPAADLSRLAGALLRGLRSKGPDRYFLYRVHEPGRIHYTLRDGPAPGEWSSGIKGVLYELVDAFPDKGQATRAWRRLEDGASPGPAPTPCPHP